MDLMHPVFGAQCVPNAATIFEDVVVTIEDLV
jgi:hypothetical protein